VVVIKSLLVGGWHNPFAGQKKTGAMVGFARVLRGGGAKSGLPEGFVGVEDGRSVKGGEGSGMSGCLYWASLIRDVLGWPEERGNCREDFVA